jgi:hypothetical protein
MDEETRKVIANHLGLQHLDASQLRDLESKRFDSLFDFHLRIKHFSPYLFAPMLAGLQQGPGFPNLSCLGTMSDRVLKTFA